MTRAARAAATVAGLAALATPAGAQSIALGAGVSVASRLLVDGNGTTVRLRPAPHVTLDLARPLHAATATSLVGTARIAWSRARASAAGSRWSAGGVFQADLSGGVRRPLSDRVRAHAALGATALVGPRDVQPFRGTLLSPLAELGLDARMGSAVRADVRLQGYRVAPDAGSAGGVLRLVVGVSHGR